MAGSATDSHGMKERILKVSMELFLKKSYRGTSVKDITDAVSISKGALYWYFKSKDELLETIIDRYDSDFLDRLARTIRPSGNDFIKTYKEYHKYINEYASSNSELCVLFTTLSAEMAGSGTVAEIRIKSVYAKYLTFIKSLLELAKNQRLLRKNTDVNVLAHTIIAIHNGILLQWYMNRPHVDGASLSRTYRDVILFGITAGEETA
jgi:AcrR family transcriptional regulator